VDVPKEMEPEDQDTISHVKPKGEIKDTIEVCFQWLTQEEIQEDLSFSSAIAEKTLLI
jgi:hypothetical protein